MRCSYCLYKYLYIFRLSNQMSVIANWTEWLCVGEFLYIAHSNIRIECGMNFCPIIYSVFECTTKSVFDMFGTARKLATNGRRFSCRGMIIDRANVYVWKIKFLAHQKKFCHPNQVYFPIIWLKFIQLKLINSNRQII